MKHYDDIVLPDSVDILLREDKSELRFDEKLLPLVYNVLRVKGYVTFKIDVFEKNIIVMQAWTAADLDECTECGIHSE
jgi:hypothetical protein